MTMCSYSLPKHPSTAHSQLTLGCSDKGTHNEAKCCMRAKINLANKSRANRMFFDNLIKEIAICINVGDMAINRDLELPSYRGKSRRKGNDVVDIGNKSQAIGFDTPAGMLSGKCIDAIDEMLRTANLKGCNSRQQISDFIKQHTDLTDCHLCALNGMMSLK